MGTTLLGDNYVHCQPEFWYVSAEEYRFCNTNNFEDSTCSDSLGPAYSLSNHATYLEVDYSKCVVGQPAPWLEIPSVLQPVDTIPAFPEPVYDFVGGAASFAIIGLDLIWGG